MKIVLEIHTLSGISEIEVDLSDPDLEQIEHWDGSKGLFVKVRFSAQEPATASDDEPECVCMDAEGTITEFCEKHQRWV